MKKLYATRKQYIFTLTTTEKTLVVFPKASYIAKKSVKVNDYLKANKNGSLTNKKCDCLSFIV